VAPRLSMSDQQRCSRDPSRHIPPRLRPLAPKLPVSHRLELEHYNIGDEQDTEVPVMHTANVWLQHSAISQPYIAPAPSSHDLTSFTLLSPLTSPDDDFPQLACGNLLSGAPVVTNSHTEHSPYGNLQLQETIQNRQGQDYWIPGIPELHTPEDAVWTGMAQPTIGFHQGQYSIHLHLSIHLTRHRSVVATHGRPHPRIHPTITTHSTCISC